MAKGTPRKKKTTEEQPQAGLTQEQALSVLIQSAKLAQSKGGVFTLEDAATVAAAIQVFTPPADEQSTTTQTGDATAEQAPLKAEK